MPEMDIDTFDKMVREVHKTVMSHGGFPSKRTHPHDKEKTAALIAARVAWISNNPAIVLGDDQKWHFCQ